MKSIKLYRKDGTFLEKRKVNLDNLKVYNEVKIKEAENYMNYLIDNEYVNNFELLDNLFSNNMNFDNLNTNYTHAIACIEQSKRIKSKLDEMGLYSYLVTCKPDKFLSKHGDELLIESHTILVHPCLYNKKISFVIFDPGFRLKNSVLIIDKENSCDKRFYDGIYKIEYKKDNDYPYEIYTNRRTDINRNIYIEDIHWKFNLYYETINIDSLYYYFIKIMYSYKIVSYSTKYENNPYVIYNVFKDLIIYSDGYNIKEIKIIDLKNMNYDEIKKLFSKCIRNVGYDIDKFTEIIIKLSINYENFKNNIIDKDVKKDILGIL